MEKEKTKCSVCVLCASHILTIPESRAVESEFGALLRYRVGRVLVVR